ETFRVENNRLTSIPSILAGSWRLLHVRLDGNLLDVQYDPDVIDTIAAIQATLTDHSSTFPFTYSTQKCLDCEELDCICAYPTPVSYSRNDYQKLVAFANQDDNLEKLGWDLSDPGSWAGITWNDATPTSPKRVTVINFDNKAVTGELDVSGFTSLTSLYAGGNQLTAIDVSGNTALQTLSVEGNQLTSLDVSSNTALRQLYAHDNQLTSLDVSSNTLLPLLEVHNNQLTALNVSKNTALTRLEVNNNQLTAINVSNNKALSILRLSNNRLKALDISNNTALLALSVNGNQLTTLDIPPNNTLNSLIATDNQLRTLDVSSSTALVSLYVQNNQLTTLIVSYNPQFWQIDASNNRLTDISSLADLPLSAVDVRYNLLELYSPMGQFSINKIRQTVAAKKQAFIDTYGPQDGIDNNYYFHYTPQKCFECEEYPCVCIQPDQPPSQPTRMGRNPQNSTNSPTTAAAYEKGDVNGDGQITALDALLVLKHVSGKEILTGAALEAADINNDGKVDANDALTILKFVVGMFDEV
ncbi:MAG: dockerin type I domain-containing protein, partial [Oscillospiraceae bacterium]|nr:dockerin type I domain-containing protein [Oscillospiraceae bacterium]